MTEMRSQGSLPVPETVQMQLIEPQQLRSGRGILALLSDYMSDTVCVRDAKPVIFCS